MAPAPPKWRRSVVQAVGASVAGALLPARHASQGDAEHSRLSIKKAERRPRHYRDMARARQRIETVARLRRCGMSSRWARLLVTQESFSERISRF